MRGLGRDVSHETMEEAMKTRRQFLNLLGKVGLAFGVGVVAPGALLAKTAKPETISYDEFRAELDKDPEFVKAYAEEVEDMRFVNVDNGSGLEGCDGDSSIRLAMDLTESND